jgi:hypothetical protein
MAPSSAEYWHIGDTMTRLVKLSSRNWIGEKSLLMGSFLVEVEIEVNGLMILVG